MNFFAKMRQLLQVFYIAITKFSITRRALQNRTKKSLPLPGRLLYFILIIMYIVTGSYFTISLRTVFSPLATRNSTK